MWLNVRSKRGVFDAEDAAFIHEFLAYLSLLLP